MTDLTTPTVRRATAADAADVAAMVGEIAAHEDQATQVHVDQARWRELLGRSEVIVLLAERGGLPVGYVSAVRQLHLWTGGDVLDLDDLYVRPGHRDAQRFYRRLGAGLRHKVLAAWPPSAYADLASPL